MNIMLRGQIALVTGASRGIGKGIALQLGEAGATVYITGRKPKDTATGPSALEKAADEVSSRGGKGIAVFCDHSNDQDIESLFKRINQEQNGRLDILVNNAYAAVNILMETSGKKFYELDPSIWDHVNVVGLKNHYICSVYAARMMVERQHGLIVTVSSPGGLRYLFNIAYGVGKAACDRLAADMAVELRKKNVASISLWPGPVKTELVKENILSGDKQMGSKDMFADGESVEYAGKAIVHYAADPNRLNKSGKTLLTADLGDEYGFVDEDGVHPPNLRSLSGALKMAKWNRLAGWVPGWVKIPGWVLIAGTSKL